MTTRARDGLRHTAVTLAALAVLALVSADRPPAARSCSSLAGRAVAQLTEFTSWTRQHGVRGVIGEVGWPETAERPWGTVASRWLADAVGNDLGFYVWGAAEQWDPDYPLAVYRASGDGAFVPGPQAPLVEATMARPTPDGTDSLRGVALAGPSFGTSDESGSGYSAGNPGIRGTHYTYPSWRFLVQLADRGIGSVRLAVMWERLQPSPYAGLDPGELAELRRVLDSAERLGMTVVVDLHNYGRYAAASPAGTRTVLLVGSPQLPASALADVWRRLALELRDSRALAAYGLMNEPHALPGGAAGWEQTTREVVSALREVDTSTLVLVPGYGWSAAATWRQLHPAPWVDDAAVAYEAHQYFDADRSGRYVRSIDEEVALAAATGCP